MKHHVYDKTVVSDLPWLGSTPSHWNFEKAKYLFKKMERPVLSGDDVVTAFRDGVVTLRSKKREEGFTFSILEIGYQGVRSGDLVIHGMDGFAGAIGVSDSDGKATPVYSVCNPRNSRKVNSYFFAYLLRHMAKSGFIMSLAKGIRERSTEFRYKEFSDLLLPVPPQTEQSAIASFLDNKTALIDDLIAKRERQVELLQEQRTAIIRHAITKGLNPDVPMKDSGVDTLGKIPKHWESARLKFLAGLNMGQSPSSEECNLDGVGVPFLQGNAEFGPEHPTPRQYCPSARKLAYPDDILLSVRAPVGALNVADQVYGIGRGLCAITPSDKFLFPRFAIYLLYVIKTELDSVSTGSTYQAVSVEQVASIHAITPPHSEQRTIASFLDREIVKIDTFVTKIQQSIEKLREYRQSLISAAVTGKLDVRNWLSSSEPAEEAVVT